MKLLSEEKRKRWCDLLIEVDIKKSSKKPWNLIKRVDSNPKEKHKIPKITPNQIAHHLLVNGKNKLRQKQDLVNRGLYERKTTRRMDLEVQFYLQNLKLP